jgi:hypothetical protein
MRIEKPSHPGHHGDLAQLRHRGEAAGQLADHLVLEFAQAGEIELRLAEAHAVRRQALRGVDHRGGVQQRLGRDAADVQAHAAERGIALHQHGLQA